MVHYLLANTSHEVSILARLSTPVNVGRSTSIATPETLALERALERKLSLVYAERS